MRRALWVWAARLLARSSRYAAVAHRQCACSLLLLLLLLYRPAVPATAAACALHGDSVRISEPFVSHLHAWLHNMCAPMRRTRLWRTLHVTPPCCLPMMPCLPCDPHSTRR